MHTSSSLVTYLYGTLLVLTLTVGSAQEPMFKPYPATIVFSPEKQRTGMIVGESASEIEFQEPNGARIKYAKGNLQQIIPKDVPPGASSTDQVATTAIAKSASAAATGKYGDAFSALFAALDSNPDLATQLKPQYDKIIREGIESMRQKSRQPQEQERAVGGLQELYEGLTSPKSAALAKPQEAYRIYAETVRTELVQLDMLLAEKLKANPGTREKAKQYLQHAVYFDNRNLKLRLSLADLAYELKDYQTAQSQYDAVAKSNDAPEAAKRSAFDGLQKTMDASGNQFRSRAIATPLARATSTPLQTPPPTMATPQAGPAAAPARTQPPYGSQWKRAIWKIENSSAYAMLKAAGSEVSSGAYTTYIIIAAVVFVFAWWLPRWYIRKRASDGDVIAGQYRGSSNLGILVLIPYLIKSLRFRAPSKPKNRCPFCNKSIDNIDQYSDLNFYTCPHCRENITPIYDLKDYVNHLISQLDHNAKKGRSTSENVEKDAMTKLVRGIITMALRRRASDLHVDGEVEGVKIRSRIDGMMYDMMTLPRNISNAFISAIKVMANLDITERRMPQDGALSLWIDKTDVDLRINTSPTPMGEKVSMRIQNQKQITVEPSKLGLEGENLEKFERSIRRPHGLIIVTGPSGSGKSTTLYVALNQLNTGERNIVTIEDPIEYQVKGLSQMQVNTAANFTFATGLRSILRQDPDVIMVGEIRDKETAEIAVEAALTGHLVLTTLHTIDAPSAFNRLSDLGTETRRLANAVICLMAMRLIRTVCPDCRKPYKPKRSDLEQLDLQDSHDIAFVHGSGCDNCLNTGYYGRIGLYEMLVPDEALREVLETNAQVSVIREVAKKGGYRTLREDGILRIRQGITTVEEVIRVTS